MAIHDYNNPQHFNGCKCEDKNTNYHLTKCCKSISKAKLIHDEIDKVTGGCMDENVLDVLVNRIMKITQGSK